MTLAEARDLTSVLNRAVRLVAELMDVKAVSIRLIDQENDELKIAAVHKPFLGVSDERKGAFQQSIHRPGSAIG